MTTHDDTVAANLGRLRAHAALLVGSRTTADSCVWVVLEAVMAEPHVLRADRGRWPGLLRVLHRASAGARDLVPVSTAPDDPLAGLATEERQAVLLLEVEGLSPQIAAFVADRGPGSLVIALMAARRRLQAGAAKAAADHPRRAAAEAHFEI